MRVLIVAGEASGDLHGSGVVRELKKRLPSIEIFGVGGDAMQREGMELLFHVKELSFMGFAEVFKHLPKIFVVEQTLEKILYERKPNVVLLIDYPGFNLRFARKAKASGTRVIYYISPQVWAWKKGRVKKMKAAIDTMCVVFPFEKDLYREEGMNVDFVGHPLLEEISVLSNKEDFFLRHHLDAKKKLVAFFPGSRKQEIEKIFPLLLKTAEEITTKLDVQIAVGVAPTLDRDFLKSFLVQKNDILLLNNQTHELMKHADAAIVTSGTATLETALLETPMMVVYKTSFATYWLGKMFVQISSIGLVNIVSGRNIVQEYIQENATVKNLLDETRRLLFDEQYRGAMKQHLSNVRNVLGTAGASRRVAEIMLQM
ncbi:MAG: lipid-A-disaccharide synthase [Ignavibacteria bacterium]|nr:lipid-A-disaccharide synthase [Ignavibacteria bacterium]